MFDQGFSDYLVWARHILGLSMRLGLVVVFNTHVYVG